MLQSATRHVADCVTLGPEVGVGARTVGAGVVTGREPGVVAGAAACWTGCATGAGAGATAPLVGCGATGVGWAGACAGC
jgi:hypothetical protein